MMDKKRKQHLRDELNAALSSGNNARVTPLEAAYLMECIDVQPDTVKVLAPDPDCSVCSASDIPGVLEYTLRIPTLGALSLTDTFTIRGLCACVRAVDIEAKREKLAGDGAYKIEHIPIVERR